VHDPSPIRKTRSEADMNPTLRTSMLSAFALTGISFLAGCQTGSDTDFRVVAANPTPELQGTVERRIDVDRHMAVTKDLNKRMFSDDLGRVFYTDHPSRLSPLPVLYTSGMPR
jgi:hypothetical protein